MTTFWFIVIAFLWTGYFVLEGFDFGVGALLPLLSRSEAERRQVLGTIGPVWDGNEVWLITAVGAMFAAFPAWYSGLLSGFYLPVFLVIAGLVVRGVGLEWRGKVGSRREVALCDAGIVAGSVLPAFLWGAIFGNLLFGTATATVLGGALSLSVAVLHGAVFVALKTTGRVRARARRAALLAAVGAVPVAIGTLPSVPGRGPMWTLGTALLAAAALTAGVTLVWGRREGWAFTATATAIAATTATVFGVLWTAPLPGLTLAEAASAPYTLTVLTWIGLIALPGVIAYQAWTYWVFRKRLTAEVS
ncbi:cytochrome c oxidase assembly protein [Microbispora rosea subsp. aerata]|nr:cytochrome d ubiquinol oxidase subunit II [Microbispora rosea]GGO18832.1 cytochrome c oxidase assembly protein [Microbispora rosea subsp. aerata]GIH54311.1 cytochrome c oxidase assembly protein [Microbispora rosea subsp. aerata]GLJ81281.1 cytochrome c oxidase assembly protein [Microbispora rosea subsp. aerata]